MSTTDIHNILSSITEAKRALEAEPGYRQRIDELERHNHRMGETIAQRELSIHNLKQTEDELRAKLRSVEAERDDAGFRLLEETDKVQALSKHLHDTIADALKLLEATGHPKQVLSLQSRIDENNVRFNELESEVDALREQNIRTSERLMQAEADRDAARREVEQLHEALTAPATKVESEAPPQSQPLPLPETLEFNPAEGIVGQSANTPTVPSDTGPSQSVSGPDATTTVSSSALGSSSLTPMENPSTTDPFVSRDNTQSPSVLSSGADASGDASLVVSSNDDVGYFNEPKQDVGYEWFKWADRMDAKYGHGGWPNRPEAGHGPSRT